MIAVSSHRPHDKATPEIRRNQIEAHKTWLRMFDRIFYFGPFEHDLADARTEFVPFHQWPQITMLASFLAMRPGLGCIINADIVLKDSFLAVQLELLRRGARSASSFRFEFDPLDPERKIARYDMGVDIFIGIPELWRDVRVKIPPDYRIGHGRWDTWMVGFFYVDGQPSFDFTGSRCVLHPKHESREQPFPVPNVKDQYIAHAQPAKSKITIQTS